MYFSEGCEERDEPGFYDFWTMECTQGAPLTGRSLDGCPGQRFEKTNTAQTATLIRPSLQRDLESWLNDPRYVRRAVRATWRTERPTDNNWARPGGHSHIVEVQAALPPTESSS